MIVHKTSPAAILPDDSTAETRAKEWAAYWTPPRQADLRAMLIAAAKANGFKADAFSTYTDHIAQISLASAGERLAQSPATLLPGFISLPSSASAHTTLAIIVDLRTDRSLRLATGWAQELRLRYPEVVILSGQMLLFDATERARAEAEQLAPWCLLAILAPLWIYFRRMGLAWLAMLCLVMGFVWVLGAAQHFAGGLNLLSLVPVLFTLGVAVDYGVYAASDPAWRHGGRGNRLSTTFLCADDDTGLRLPHDRHAPGIAVARHHTGRGRDRRLSHLSFHRRARAAVEIPTTNGESSKEPNANSRTLCRTACDWLVSCADNAFFSHPARGANSASTSASRWHGFHFGTRSCKTTGRSHVHFWQIVDALARNVPAGRCMGDRGGRNPRRARHSPRSPRIAD